jgi:hypothetical protein
MTEDAEAGGVGGDAFDRAYHVMTGVYGEPKNPESRAMCLAMLEAALYKPDAERSADDTPSASKCAAEIAELQSWAYTLPKGLRAHWWERKSYAGWATRAMILAADHMYRGAPHAAD